MSKFHFNVCDLAHHFSSQSLKLSSNCKITISYNADSVPVYETSNTQCPPTLHSLWISFGYKFRISMNLDVNGLSMETGGLEGHIEQLGSALRDAELWSQLCLRPSLVIPGAEDGNSGFSGRFHLDIVHAEESSSQIKKSQDPLAASTRPPHGVASANIEIIDIICRLSHTTNQASKKRLRQEKLELNGANDDAFDEILFGVENDASQDFISMSQPNPQSSTSWNLDNDHLMSLSQPLACSSPEEMLDRGDSANEPNHMPANMPIDKIARCHAVSVSTDCIPSKKRAGYHSEPHVPEFSTLLQLFEAAFRQIICDKTVRSPPGIKLRKKSAGPKLAEISPAIFSPGYLQALSNNSQFIIPLAQYMTSVYSHSKSAKLRSNFAKFSEPSAPAAQTSNASPGSVEQTTEADMVAAIKCKLWTMAQKKMYVPLAAWRLKPITSAEDESSTAWVRDEMLDEPCSPPTLVGSPEDAGSPWHCLLNGPDEPNRNEDEYLNDLGFGDDEILDDYEYSDIGADLLDNLLFSEDSFHAGETMRLPQGMGSAASGSMEILDDDYIEASSILDDLSI